MSGWIGDEDRELTFAAVGRGITRWEAVELAFANLYALFTTNSLSLDKVREFGAQNRIFANRLVALKRASAPFFRSRPCQEAEGGFASLCNRAQVMAETRNAIAHGIVGQVTYLTEYGTWPPEYVDGPSLWMLQTPWYARDSPNTIKQEGMGSKEILIATEPFKALAFDIDEYVLQTLPLVTPHELMK